MEQYINKAALVAEIENRIKELQNFYKENEEKLNSILKTAILLCIDECKVILSLLDTLEVKGVDLNEEVKKYLFNCIDNDGLKPINIAKHFFELGMAVSNKA